MRSRNAGTRMNPADRLPPRPEPAPTDAAAPRPEMLARLRAVHRAAGELRRGTPVLLLGATPLVMVPAETVGARGLAELRSLSAGPAVLELPCGGRLAGRGADRRRGRGGLGREPGRGGGAAGRAPRLRWGEGLDISVRSISGSHGESFPSELYRPLSGTVSASESERSGTLCGTGRDERS